MNNAAIHWTRPIEFETADGFERIWRVNLLGAFLGIKAVIEPAEGVEPNDELAEDILQFCANFFGRRLEAERAQFLLSTTTSTQDPKMSGSTFPGRLGTNANPFGGEGAGVGNAA